MKKISLLALLALPACGPLYNIPDDLTYVEMHFGSGPLVDYGRDSGEGVEVILVTNEDYQLETIKNNNGAQAFMKICNHEYNDGNGSIAYSPIYRVENGKYIPLWRGNTDNGSPPYTYRAFFWTYQTVNAGDSKKYDLRERPHDLCLTFSNSGLGYYNHSNTVRIPKEELIKLFATQPRKPVPEAFK